MENKKQMQGLGSALIDRKSYLFLCDESDIQHGTFTVREGTDGIDFVTLTQNAKIVNINGPADEFDQCGFLHASKDGKTYYMTYRVNNIEKLCIARSKNLIDWEKTVELDGINGNGKIVSDYLYAGRNVMFTGGDAIRVHVSRDMQKWTRAKKDLIAIDLNEFQMELFVLDVQIVDDGVFVMYAAKTNEGCIIQYKIYGALFDYGDPTKMIWRSQGPIYQTQNTKNNHAALFGAVVFDEYFVSYWMDDAEEMFLLRHFYRHEEGEVAQKNVQEGAVDEQYGSANIALERAECNPIIAPKEQHLWESRATYNPTAIVCDGVVHIVYRADGHDAVSVLGYASSEDGFTIDERHAQCIYRRNAQFVHAPFPTSHTSGNNSNGGCEDPRMVLIDGVLYITFTAFDGWGSLRMALTSISWEDFKNKKWNWKKTTLISPPGEKNKNWVIFPEKINGKFAIMHSFYPEILIDYFDSLDELDGTKFIKSNNTRPVDHTRTWDSWFRGVGPAPLKTEDGWLVFYHAMDHRNSDRYRLGALILDYQDPTKILFRTREPILEPQEPYENDGHKWGVIYSCGAVIKDDTLFVYYGGSDACVCVATAPIQQFLDELKRTGSMTTQN
ncbi:MAG: hypothetical protein WC819_04550 [Parcubacteria group bacterium]|jgi:predicted GH43/DUF377 family glycosyl hydrolase